MANRNPIIAQCIARGVIHEQGGIEAATEKYDVAAERLGKWEALNTVARVTPKAARVAGFIAFWAIGMRETGVDEFSITEYQRFWNENERQAYRLQKEFRELWPEYETPHELARQIVQYPDDRERSKGDVAMLPAQLQVVA